MDFDVAIIGGGPGGYVAAIRLSQLGRKVGLVEKEKLGGTCLNVGCIPSKALIRAGRIRSEGFGAEEIGISAKEITLDLGNMISWKDKVVERVTKGVSELLRLNKVRVFNGKARILEDKKIEIEAEGGDRETIEAKEIIIATGSLPIEIPGFPFDGELIWSSTHALSPPFLPKRLLVIGGGYIGLELGLTFWGLGSEITVVEALDNVLPGLDEDLRKEMARSLRKKKIKVYTMARAASWEKTSNGVSVKVNFKGKEESIEADAVLVTVGRRPYDGDTGARELGVEYVKGGFMKTDPTGKTNIPWIRAIGDVAGPPMLAHKASKQALKVAESIAGNNEAVFRPRAVPAVVFIDPEIASVGMTSLQARENGIETLEGKFPIRALGRSVTLGALDGFVKIIAEKETRKVIGVHMMGPEVSELIAAGALAVEKELTLDDLAETIQCHPTIAEALPEAAEAALGSPIHIFMPKKKT